MSLNRASTHVPVAAAEETTQREAVRAAARKTVARYSNGDLDACRDLLDMLGLRGEALCACGLPMSRPRTDGGHSMGGNGLCWKCFEDDKRAREHAAVPRCACGRTLAAGQHLCRACSDSVPADDVRAVVARILELTGRDRRHIAEMAGVRATALTSVCVPSSKVQRVRRDIYDKLLAAEQRCMAMAAEGVL